MAEEDKNMDQDNEFTDKDTHTAVEIGTGVSELEFRFLCASYAITSLVGFEIPATDDTPQQQMQELLNMLNRGLLKQQEDRFVVSEEIRELMECIATRISTMRIWSPESAIPNCVIYVGENRSAVMACPGKKKGEYAVLTYLPSGTLPAFLASSDIIPSAFAPEEISEVSRELNKAGISIPEGMAIPEKDIRLEIMFYEGANADHNIKLDVVWFDEQELVVVDSGDTKSADLYITKELISLICALSGAEE